MGLETNGKCIKTHMEYPPSHIGVILRTLTCSGYYAELLGRKLVMYPPSRSSGYGFRNEWLVANHGPNSLEIFKKYRFG